jgi:hypothetical protein
MNTDRSFYPSEPLIDTLQWRQIMDYYTALAPDSIDAAKNDEAIPEDLQLFEVMKPVIPDSQFRVSYVGFDAKTVMAYEVISKRLFRFNSSLEIIDSVAVGSSLIDFAYDKNNIYACDMGVMMPNDGKYGTINRIVVNESGKMVPDTTLVARLLRRPVQSTLADLNADGKKDLLVCEFGNNRGALSWLENLGNDKYEYHVIREVPGAIKAWIVPSKNGLPDIYALFAQGDEGVFKFTNKGGGAFEEKRVVRFPPVYGSSYFEFADMNNDGHADIIYTCGDNADYSIILKPYHGVYIYLNDGKDNFEQKYFFHINGCYKAMARDFDADGDLDIATISFFADYKNRPNEGFVYFENKGKLQFKPSTINATSGGRWLTMEAGDLDGDDKTDLILGNFSAKPMSNDMANFGKTPPFLLLKNKGIRK